MWSRWSDSRNAKGWRHWNTTSFAVHTQRDMGEWNNSWNELPRKGDFGDCDNRRGVALLPITSKVLSKIIHTRLFEALDKYIRQEQTGFRPGLSCSDHIFTLKQILEHSKEWNAPLYVNFIDFEKPFDSIHRDSLWKILRHYGTPPKLENVIKMLLQRL